MLGASDATGEEAMWVRLKGVHRVRSKGKTYYYAWRGGPRVVGVPGSPEFIASYHAAYCSRRKPNAALFQSLIAAYLASTEFSALRERTRSDYLKQISKIEADFASLPLDALEDPRVTRDFLNWRDSLASSPRQADYAWTVLMRLISWARGRGLTTYRPPDRVARLYHGDRAEKVWSDEDVAAFMAVAPLPLQRALVLALETGQRQGDLLTLPWSAYDGTWICSKDGHSCSCSEAEHANRCPRPPSAGGHSSIREGQQCCWGRSTRSI
jgi:hypothetical protein